METVLIDTNILIGRARREPRALSALSKVPGSALVICDAVAAEVLSGVRNRAEYDATLRELDQHFHSLPLTIEVSRNFRDIISHYARDHGVHFADYLIAATAIAHDVPLLTLNTKHFKGIKGLKLV